MTRISIYLPEGFRDRMRQFRLNWSQIARKAFQTAMEAPSASADLDDLYAARDRFHEAVRRAYEAEMRALPAPSRDQFRHMAHDGLSLFNPWMDDRLEKDGTLPDPLDGFREAIAKGGAGSD